MSFSFNFDVQSQGEECPKSDIQKKEEEAKPDNTAKTETICVLKTKQALEHKPPVDSESLFENSVTETLTVGSLPPLHYLNECVFERTAGEREDDEQILSWTKDRNTDLISGVYEGGLKIWECTYDLLEHMDDEGETFLGKSVLDLGCGAGLLGILAFRRGARRIDFQDYNSTVIEQLTVPNVLLNCEEDSDEEGKNGNPSPKKRTLDETQPLSITRCNFFSGDWSSFLSLILSKEPVHKYDIIFTSETIYNTEYYPSLHNVFQKLLADDGIVYLASKSHYFGVGGGLHLFQTFVEQKDVFQMKCLKDIEQGLKRHVVSLKFKKTKSET
ncbi:histidine protein methyltransferase 1 homolog [Chanos chanos]|uniref:protein-histidine N-methyltransferase n=1 Tax=Chanos chanos TaxID=29144 RepID=A0A6J2V8U3_CHACN|nr:histidine protein methyltransferase 1 homolog [Chanos chanos]